MQQLILLVAMFLEFGTSSANAVFPHSTAIKDKEPTSFFGQIVA